MKLCTLCGRNEIYKHSRSWCRLCINKHCALWRQRNPDKVRRAKAKYLGRNAKVVRERQLLYRKKRRLKVLRYYGKDGELICECCKEKRLEFLCIDHTNGGGNKHRKLMGTPNGSGIYQWIIKNDFPSGFRILCYNCNNSYGHYNYCPHQNE